MKRSGPRFDPDDLRLLAGDRTFARGLAYFRDGAVRLSRVDARSVAATVGGSEDYEVRLSGVGARIGGSCTCPAFEDGGFCKHMVAAALAAGEAGQADDPVAPIRAHLAAQPPEALVALLLEQADRDPGLMRRLAAVAAAAGDPAKGAAALRRELDAVTRPSRLPEYRGVRGWAREVEELLDAIGELVARADPATALALAEHAVERVDEASGSVDDSDGYAGGLLVRAAELHLTACTRARPDPRALARDLLGRELSGVGDAFYHAAWGYAEVLGPEGVAEYRRLAQEAWDRIPPRGPRDAGRSREPGNWTLFRLLDGFAEEAGELDARIALRRKDLSSAHGYVELARFCAANGRPDEALAAAEEGLFVFEDRPDERLSMLAADLLAAADRPAEAEAQLWRAFARFPSAELYRALARRGGGAARDRALSALEAGLPGNATLLVELLTEQRRWERAWAVVRAHRVAGSAVERLARASEAKHPREALAVYAARVEQLAGIGGDGAYREAVELVARMAGLRPAAEQAAYLAELRARHARKRNLMRLLG